MAMKLLVCFHPKKVYKDQILVEEGVKSSFMYLIKEGEFELSKKIKRDLRVDIDYSQFMSKE